MTDDEKAVAVFDSMGKIRWGYCHAGQRCERRPPGCSAPCGKVAMAYAYQSERRFNLCLSCWCVKFAGRPVGDFEGFVDQDGKWIPVTSPDPSDD